MEAFGIELLDTVQKFFGKRITRETVPVAVVVASRNYGHYLRDCLESVLRQEPAPAEIIYVDNASTDTSIAIARSCGVRIAAVSAKPVNICACRNRGAALTKQPFIIFLDADDWLTDGYVKKMHDVISHQRRVGVAWPQIETFGLIPRKGHSYKGQGYYSLLRQNHIDTTSIWRRAALEEVGGWNYWPIFEDWELALRIVEQGWLIIEATGVWIHKRSHAGSLTANSFQISETRESVYQEILRCRPMTIFTPFGPGAPPHRERYFDMLNTLGLKWDTTTLLFYDNSHSSQTADRLKGYLRDSPARGQIYHKDNYRRKEFCSPSGRLTIMPQRMAEIWNRANDMFTGAFVMSIEADHEPYEPNAVSRLYEGILHDVDAVNGLYYTKGNYDGAWPLALEWYLEGDGATAARKPERFPGDLVELPRDLVVDIGLCGVGWSLIRRDALSGFPFLVGEGNRWIGQDFGLWRHVKERGMRVMMHYGVRIKHWQDAGNYR